MITKLLARLLRGNHGKRRSAHVSLRHRRPRIESLESRHLLSITLPSLAAQSLLSGTTLNVALNGSDTAGNAINYTVAVSNSQLTDSSVSNPQLTATVPQGNPSIKIVVSDTADNVSGTMILQLFQDQVSSAVSEIEGLIAKNFYNNLTFHRIVKGFMIQGGDPNGNGSGGPGFKWDDNINQNLQFTSAGVLAMANSGPDTNGSQFFITAAPERYLDYRYTIFGFLTQGSSVLQQIENVPVHTGTSGEDSSPNNTVKMTSVTSYTDTQNGVLRLSAPAGATGTATVTVTATDSVTGATSQQSFTVSVAQDTTVDPPFLSRPISALQATSSDSVSFSIPTVNTSGAAMTFSGSVSPAVSGLSLTVNSATGQATLTSSSVTPGVYSVQVGVAAASPASGEANSADTQLVPVHIDPTPPTGITLAAASSSGSDQTDLDNSASEKLQFTVDGVLNGAVVQVFSDGTLIGSGTASGTSATVTTNGTVPLTAGVHQITATQTLDTPESVGNLSDTANLPSTASTALPLTVVAAPSGYTITADEQQVTNSNISMAGFTITGATVGATYNYTITSSGNSGATSVTGSGTVATAQQDVSDVNVAALPNGTLSYKVTLTGQGGAGGAASATASLNQTVPSDYTVTADQSTIDNSNAAAAGFTLDGAEVGAIFDYTISSDAGGTPVTGTGTVTSATQDVSDVNVAALPNGTLNYNVTLSNGAGAGAAATPDASPTLTQTVPSGYTITADQSTVDNSNAAMAGFTFAGAEVGATFDYTISSEAGGTPVTGTGKVTSATQDVSDVNVAALPNGTLNYSVTLTNGAGAGTAASVTATLNQTAPTGYTITADEGQISSSNASTAGFTFAGAQVGATYNYTVSSSGGGSSLTGTGTITSATQNVSNINVAALPDGTLTYSVALSNGVGSGTAATATAKLTQSTASLAGYVYINRTNSGTWSASDMGLEGVTVRLFSSADGQSNWTEITDMSPIQTKAGGAYSFQNLPAGWYQIQETPPPAFLDGKATAGSLGGTVGGTAGVMDQIQLQLTAAQNGTGYDFSVQGLHLSRMTWGLCLNSTPSGIKLLDQVHTAPSVDLTGSGGGSFATTFAAGGSPALIASSTASITSPDSSTLASMTVTLEDPAAGDSEVLAATASAPITVHPYSGGVLSLTGVANVSAYQTALESVTYSDGKSPPTLGARKIQVVVNDGTGSSLPVTSTVTVATSSVNPTIKVDKAAIGAADSASTGFTFSGAEVGATYTYSVSSSGGGTDVTGSGTVTTTDQDVTGINVSSLNDGTLTYKVTLTGTAGVTGQTVTATATLDQTAPSGYEITADRTLIGASTAAAAGFTFSNAEVGATYNYTVTSSGNSAATSVTGSGTITAADQDVTNIDVSTLPDGTLTYNVTLTDTAGNKGVAAVATASLDQTAPQGYTITADEASLNNSTAPAAGFTFVGAEVGATYKYTVTSDGNSGATSVTGSGTVNSQTQDVNDINVVSLPNGTLTYSVTLTDTAGNEGAAAKATATLTQSAPSGYSITADAGASPITNSNLSTAGFTFSGAQVGATYNYTVTSSGNSGTPSVTGSGTVSSATQDVKNVNVSTLPNGTLTYKVTLTNGAGTGAAAQATATLDAQSLTITANNVSMVYGSALPTLTVSYSGFVNGDTSASLSTQPTPTTTATAASPVGTYPITVSGAVDANYNIIYVAGTLTVTKAPLTITANNQSMALGAALPTLTVGYSGFVNGDSSAKLSTQPSVTTTATSASPVGSYPITASGAVDPNYSITYVTGTLTVTSTATPAFSGLAAPTITVGTASTTLSGTISLVPTDGSESVSMTLNGVTQTAAVGASGSFSSSFSTSALTAAGSPYTITYSYPGDTNLKAVTNTSNTLKVSAATSNIATVAGTLGSSNSGYTGDGGAATAAKLNTPFSVAVDSAGDIFIADTKNNVIREVNHTTGIISTVVGGGTNNNPAFSGPASGASGVELTFPNSIALDSAGNLYIADNGANVIRKVAGLSTASPTISTVAGTGAGAYGGDGGLATAAYLNNPAGVAVDSSGDIFIADTANNVIREVNTSGVISTVAGTGTAGNSGNGGLATAATLNEPQSIAVDSSGDIFIADTTNNVIREVLKATGNISTVAGGGTNTAASYSGPPLGVQFAFPLAIAIDASGNLYVADTNNNVVRKITAVGTANAAISTIAGSGTGGDTGDGGSATAAELSSPLGVTVNAAGQVFIADGGNNAIRRVG
jgi:cyclophilin family peptidyl-prolyl cis-trans isomerase